MNVGSATPTSSLPTSPKGQRLRRGLVLALMAAVLAACAVLSLCLGRYSIAPADVVKTLLAPVFGFEAPDAMMTTVVFNVRLPRILMSVLVGAALAVSGAAFQAVFGNPLVSPDILGVSAGASFGAALAILASGSALLIQGMALGFGLVAVGMVMLLGRVQSRMQLYMLVLVGVVVSALFEAFVSIIKYVCDPYDKLPAITSWLLGSLATATYRDVAVAAAVILPCALVLLGLRWKLNLLSLDEEEARSLGMNVSRLRSITIVAATFMTATTVALCGVIGWIGLVIPHIARLMLGNDHRTLVPASLLLGGMYLLAIDDIARCATGVEIPLSILTAIVGAPFFAWLIRTTAKEA